MKGTVTAFNLSADNKTIASVSYRAENGKTVDVPSSLVSGEFGLHPQSLTKLTSPRATTCRLYR